MGFNIPSPGLSPPALQALCKLVSASEAGEQLIHKVLSHCDPSFHTANSRAGAQQALISGWILTHGSSSTSCS